MYRTGGGHGKMIVVAAGIVISWVEADRTWAAWIAYQLGERGFPVHWEYAPGSNRAYEYGRMLREGYRVIAVVSPHSLADEVAQGDWVSALHHDPTGAARRVVPVLVEPCDPGVLAPLVPLRLYRLGKDDAADHLLAALGILDRPQASPEFPGTGTAEDDSLRAVDSLIKRAPENERRFLVSSDDPLPRLRVLSDRARAEAGQVTSGPRIGDHFGAGLYVRRDVEAGLLDGLREGAGTPRLLVGEPGAGKTSLLWGIATGLLADSDGREVFLVKATWLRATRDQPALVTPGLIASAVARSSRGCTLLVDTADLVVNDEDGYLALVGAVDAAVAGGASVAVTSRPAEAQLLPTKWRRVPLGSYNTASGDDAPSEFERAVASHSRFYCASAESAREMAARLISAVARRQPLGQLCLRPLTLRLLFELYAPSTVADNVDVTGLYYEFWRDRVVRDRRVWAPGTPIAHDDDRDLAPTVRSFALAMLREGTPEIALGGSFDPAEDERIHRDVDLLVQRGVGERVTGGAGTAFRFFHQTFFEFAAAQALLYAKGAAALSLVESRIRGRADDYFLLAVFEQTWLCAWRDRAMAATAGTVAVRMLDELLKEFEPDWTGTPLPYALQRTVLAVLAQSPDIPGTCRDKLGDVLAVASLPVVRDCLSLMPPPLRTWTEDDLSVLARCASRTDAAWVTVLDVLSRLSQRDPALTVVAVRRLGLVERASGLDKQELARRADLLKLLAGLLPAEPEFVLTVLRELGRAAVRRDANNYLATILRLVAERAEDLPDTDLGSWADSVVGRAVNRKQAVVLAHTEAHRLRALWLAARGGWSLVLIELKTVLATVACTDQVRADDGARLGGLLVALATEGPLWTADVVGMLLRERDEPQLHAELHRGWLVGYTRRAPNKMIDIWADWLAEGLPASHHRPDGVRQRWADTIRRILEREDVDAEVATGTAQDVARRMGGDQVALWLDPDILMRLVVRGAAAGIPAARSAVERISQGRDLAPHAIRAFLQQAVRAAGSVAEWEVLIDVLIAGAEHAHLHQFLDQHPDLPVSVLQSRERLLGEMVEASLASHRTTVRCDGGRLFAELVRCGGLKPPRWSSLVQWLDEAADASVRRSLVLVMAVGLDSGQYSPTAVRDVLRPLSQRMSARGPTVDVLAARSLLVVVLARWGEPDDAGELLRVAFQEPVEAAALAKVSSFVQPAHRGGARRPKVRGVPFLLKFGRRLKAMSRRARKDTAVWWRAAMSEVIGQATVDEQVHVLHSLAELDEQFAANIVLQMEPWRHAAVRHEMNALVDDPRVGDQLRRNLRLVLAEKTQHHARYDWPELPSLLGAAADRHQDGGEVLGG
ncbi:TIR domain-containing protein [Allokutzneria oryzae]|uniref:TIR domain-containing protein n=1 Tax=Allokutzneria oryzae TaxID=1378989 RepID=A0ABV5ZXK8_9PSEU